jgi:energy-coupling factor transporter ATP-binding protein EcfA2
MPPKLASDVTNKLSHSMINHITIIHSQINPYDEFNKHEFISPTSKSLAEFFIKQPNVDPQNLMAYSKYIGKIVSNSKFNDHTIINYKQSSKSALLLGRFYNDPHKSLVPLCKIFKHTIFKFLSYTDIDMVSGHASILVSVCEKRNILCDHVKAYIINKESVLIPLIAYYPNIDKTDIKFLFNIILYGGTFNTWIEKLAEGEDGSNYQVKNSVNPKFIDKSKQIPDFIIQFEKECINFKNEVIKANVELYELMVKTYTEKNMTDYNYKNAFLSIFFQFIENHTIWLSYLFLVENKYIEPNVVVLEYDGLCIPNPRNGKYNEINQLTIDNLNIFLKEMLELDYVKMSIKPYNPDQLILDEYNKLIEDQSYEKVKFMFEYNYDNEIEHFMIISIPTYMRVLKPNIIKAEDAFKYFSEYDMNCAYRDIKYIDANGKEQKFLTRWLDDSNKRSYQYINCFPIISECPANTYNSWSVFKMEKLITYTPDLTGLELCRKHIYNIITNRNQVLFDYFEAWIASSVQCPIRKIKCPVVVGREGAGKTTLIGMLKGMFGEKLVFECSKPSRDIYGMFNARMSSCYIAVLSELKRNELDVYESEMKALLTDDTIDICKKGKDTQTFNSYHRVIIVTNTEDPVNLKEGQRRYFYLNTSDEAIGNGKYFNDVYKAIKSIDCMKTLYQYYKNFNIPDSFYECPPPISQEEEICKAYNIAPVSLYLKSKFNSYCQPCLIETTNSKLFIEYNEFKKVNNIDTPMTQAEFSKKISIDKNYSKFICTRSISNGTKCINVYMILDELNVSLTKTMSKDYYIKKYNNWHDDIKRLGNSEYENYLINYDSTHN